MTPAGKFLGDWLFAIFLGAIIRFFIVFIGTILSIGLVVGLAVWLLS